MKAWPRVPLADIAPIVRRAVDIQHDQDYPEMGIRSFGKGTFHKPPLAGADAGTKRLFRIEPGDLVFSNVFAWEGAIAVASTLDGERFGSHRFITCVVDSSRASAAFLKFYLTASDEGQEQIRRASPGGAGRNRTLGVEKLGQVQVPLPPLEEQQAIVARLDALAEKTRQLEAHLDAADNASAALLLSLHHRLGADRTVRLGDIIELHELAEPIRLESQYPQVGVRGFGGGLFAKAAIAGSDTAYKTFNRLYTDAIVLSQVKGWEGAIALCPTALDGMFVSPEYRTFRCKSTEASPAYLGELFRTEWFWSRLQEATRGVGARRERTRPEQFLNIQLPMPGLMDQLKIAEILAKQVPLKAKHTAIRAANAALLPATLERLFQSRETSHA
jgi:type I restriction enzyme, S subunit